MNKNQFEVMTRDEEVIVFKDGELFWNLTKEQFIIWWSLNPLAVVTLKQS